MSFTPTGEAARQEVLDFAANEIRVYGVDVINAPEGFFIASNKESWKAEAEAQGLVWSLAGFEKAFNKESFSRSLIIKFY
jgi:hypothetical protein